MFSAQIPVSNNLYDIRSTTDFTVLSMVIGDEIIGEFCDPFRNFARSQTSQVFWAIVNDKNN